MSIRIFFEILRKEKEFFGVVLRCNFILLRKSVIMSARRLKIRLSKFWVLVVSAMSVALVACCVCSKKTTEVKTQDISNREQMRNELDSLKKVQERRNAVAIYGTPDVMRSYGEENARLQQRIDSLQHALDNR